MSDQRENIVAMRKKMDLQADHVRKLEQRICNLRAELAALKAPAVAGDEQSAVVQFGIQVEKLMCSKLGIEWTPVGISIESLIDRMAARPAQTEQQLVRLPERREPSVDHPYLSDADCGWNAALDEVARLNAAPIAQTPACAGGTVDGRYATSTPSTSVGGIGLHTLATVLQMARDLNRVSAELQEARQTPADGLVEALRDVRPIILGYCDFKMVERIDALLAAHRAGGAV